MFVRRDYARRAIGLAAAFAVLIVGVITTGSLASAPTKADEQKPVQMQQSAAPAPALPDCRWDDIVC